MFNRSGLFLLLIIAGVVGPYMMSEEQAGTRARLANIWDKMFTDTISDRYPNAGGSSYRDPMASASPLPGRNRTGRSRGRLDSPPWEYRLPERVAQFSANRSLRRDYSGAVGGPATQNAPRGYRSGDSFSPVPLPNSTAEPTAVTYPQGAYNDQATILPNGGTLIRHGLYPNNPLEGVAPENGATEWETVGPAIGTTTLRPDLQTVPESGGMTTSLPIPHSAIPTATPAAIPTVTGQTVGVPDEEGWVTVGPAADYASGARFGSGATALQQMQGVPPGAEILPGIVVGGPGASGAPGAANANPSRQAAQQDLSDLLTFAHNPDWVIESWPRVSTHIIQSDLSGMRVPLVSGTSAEDLAGSLSYYFDRGQELQRISFEGATGDPTRLIELVTSEHKLKAEPSLGGGMYVSRGEQGANPIDSITSVLRLRRAPIVRNSRPLQKYLVMLELNRPRSNRKISREFGRLLHLDSRSNRWIPGSTSNPLRQVPTDPLDPFSPANPNDAFLPDSAASPVPPKPNGASPPQSLDPQNLPQQQNSALQQNLPQQSKPPAGAVPSSRGVLPSGTGFQDQTFRQAPVKTGSMMPALRRSQMLRSYGTQPAVSATTAVPPSNPPAPLAPQRYGAQGGVAQPPTRPQRIGPPAT